MTKYIYVMYDEISKTYTVPFFEINNEKVFRDFNYLINESKDKSEIQMFYKDKILFQLGTFDEKTGLINLLENPVKILELKQFEKKETAN